MYQMFYSNSCPSLFTNEGLGSIQSLLLPLIKKVSYHIFSKRFFDLVQFLQANAQTASQLLIIPVYLFRFAYQEQYNLKYSEEELCIFPNVDEEQLKAVPAQNFSISNLLIAYANFLHGVIISDKTNKQAKSLAFESLIMVHRIHNPAV